MAMLGYRGYPPNLAKLTKLWIIVWGKRSHRCGDFPKNRGDPEIRWFSSWKIHLEMDFQGVPSILGNDQAHDIPYVYIGFSNYEGTPK